MIYVFILITIVILGYLVYIHVILSRLTKRLKYINSIQTNLIIELPTKNSVFLRLITQINKMIEQNKQNHQQLVEIQTQFDMAINNISHDIRTPLTVASGYTQILVKQVDTKQKNLVKKISTNLTDVEKKLDDLLTYNRLMEDRVEVELESVNVSSLIESKIVTYYEAFKKKQIELDIIIEKNVHMISDKDILSRIIDNALGNILNHGIDKGTVNLSKNGQVVNLVFFNHTDQVISNYEKLFERFYTEDLSRVNKNSGLGLYIIKELSTLLGGTTEVSGNKEYFELLISLPSHKKTSLS
ncbi:hypothetical protein BW731_07715 [Vagococcus martis]|uniref:histidine kinase n=1 Tax=Vagococcus martis TaxID=1768210 RepID=A0A1V4DHX7_9ENTE|nr:HAMP domain-containing sensor histidine kinase [Vagococcus martis]OPF88063.1 hypothetical protein BW731_07715 [Vagococcus martis]